MVKRARHTRKAKAAPVTLNLLSAIPLSPPRAVPLICPPDFEERAWRLNYALRNRKRWTTRGAAAQQQSEDILKIVRDLGLGETESRDLADARLVEVSIPFVEEDKDWALRIFPWEYVLASATRERRHALNLDFTVVRHLDRPTTSRTPGKKTFLYVESAPTRVLADAYDFTEEQAMARKAASTEDLEFIPLANPTLADLRKAIRDQQPQVVHLTGFDTHQARSMLDIGDTRETTSEDSHLLDGFVLAGTTKPIEEIASEQLARVLNEGGAHPDLICCNFFNSAARTAALCVAYGAGAAVGFQDTFNDRLGELFFNTLYRAWKLTNRATTSAFRYAWQQVRQQGRRTTGTGVVLWNAESIALPQPKTTTKKRGAIQATPTGGLSPQDVAGFWNTQSSRTVTETTARQDLSVTVQHAPQLNYSMLHNNRPLFRAFTIAKTSDDIGKVDGLRVNVELHVGRDSYPFRMQLSIPATQSSSDIAPDIRISLASTLNRTVRESVHTSLLIEVRFEKTLLFRETRRVTLLPVDEWQDSDANRKWLPSFVLPRDPAVARVIDNAQRYLQSLTDDPTAGFDGYQSVAEIEGKTNRFDCAGVDLQVRAIWSALLYETPLSYINPPPTFTDASQRLRSPSEIIDGHRGTCIDLALLVASCLEYVEIHPTIILLSDHAFPCYWRAEEYFDNFALASRGTIDAPKARRAAGTPVAQQQDSWYFVKEHFREVLGEIVAGRLVPIESTCLCWRNGFAEACEQGAKNLSRRSRFDSMLDVRLARADEESPVTPLPVLRGEG